MDLFPVAVISTIKTKTNETTQYQILNACRYCNIEDFMQKTYHLKLHLQIKAIEEEHLRLFSKEYKSQKYLNAKTVNQNLQQNLLVQSSVATVKKEEMLSEQELKEVKCLKGQSLKVGSLFAKDANLLLRVRQPMPNSVQNVEKIDGVAVYDLTVQEDHEFFANGILVHNSEDRSASHTVGLLMASMREEYTEYGFIVLDMIYGQWTSGERDIRMKQTAQMDGIEVEHVVEQEGGSGGKESAQNSIKKVFLGYKCSADHPSGAKDVRLEPFAGQVENNNVAMLSASWNKRYVEALEECSVGSVTDFGDASSGAFNWLNGLNGKGKSKVRIGVI